MLDDQTGIDLREVVFAPIGGDGLVDQTVRRLTDAINSGLLEDNERLPSEAQLSGWLGISAMTLRDALSELRESGYLETRRGRYGGTFVRRAPAKTSRAAAVRRLATVDAEYLRDLTDYRRAISAEAAAEAAKHASADDLGAIADLIREASEAGDRYSYLKLDAELHIAITAASGSERLMKEQTAVEMELNGVVTALAPRRFPARHPERDREHDEILKALQTRDGSRARELMTEHVNRGGEILIEWTRRSQSRA